MSDIEEIKSRLDIVDVISNYVPTLKKAGRSYKGNCPFHQEKTPSFIVTPDMQRFKCFGCGEGGDVLTFIQKIERVDLPKALEIAAERAGYELKRTYSPQSEKIKQEIARLLRANELAAKYWNYLLKTHPGGKAGRDYAAKRGIRIEEIEKFTIGYATAGKFNLLKFLTQKGFTQEELLRWGLLMENNGIIIDKFRDRLILSISNQKGEIIGFSGRKVAPSEYAPKYVNSPETLVYKKGEILMGLYQAIPAIRQHKFVILEEGNIDLLSSHKIGIENIVAVGGTALTENQVKLIKHYADEIYFAFDVDQAGLKALINGLAIAERMGIRHKVIDLGVHQDPDAMINTDPKLWEHAVQNPYNTVQFILTRLQASLDMGNPDDKSTLLSQMIPILRSLHDPVQQAHFAEQLAVEVGLSKSQVLQLIDGKSVTNTAAESETPVTDGTTANTADKQQVYFLALLIERTLQDLQEISPEIFTDINCQEIFWKLKSKVGQAINYSELAEEISDGAKETLQQVLAIEVADEDIETEFNRTYALLRKKVLQNQLMELRQQLHQDPENQPLLQELQNLTFKLKKL